MKTQTAAATALTVAAQHKYTGPLGRQLAKLAQLATVRRQILDIVENWALFTEVEHLSTNDSVYQCECLEQLERWLRNVSRVAAERKDKLRLDFADDSSAFLPVEIPPLPEQADCALEEVTYNELQEFDLVVRLHRRSKQIDLCGRITALKLTCCQQVVQVLLTGERDETITVVQHHPGYCWYRVVMVFSESTAQPA